MASVRRCGPLPWARLLAPATLELLALPCGLQEPEQRPCISDDLKIGYHTRDHATQTDIKEIPELNELAIATQALIELTHSLQKDLFIYKSTIQARYEEKIEEQASNLYKYVNDRLTDIETFHKRKEVQIRQSYQQQLCDALAVLRANIEKYYNIDIEDRECSPGKLLRFLRDKLREKESIIEDLKRKMQEYQETERTKMVVFEDDDRGNKKLEKENEEFKEEVFKLRNDIARLENSLQHSEKEKRALDRQVQRMQLKMESDEQTVQQLVEFQEQMKAELENRRSLDKNLITNVAPEQQSAERSLTAENGKLKTCEGQERQTIARKEAEQSNAIWKKKFQIVQNSLHAIKDEMFLRQTLQHRLLALRYTSPGETMICPVCIENYIKGTNGFEASLHLPSTLPPLYSQSNGEQREDTDEFPSLLNTEKMSSV
ncbi:uncharacterized protein C10orf67 homolog, mitochondrial isoform X1 [Gallus gallus]|uniref:uncharacterized protein C10orf67 homolog, mitochondrial isoform X1 n=1 Tax=Gallus gallus TaxID=9031 RepID=UPI0002C879AA|nr:uncharacterized protein C10orf67 homolog, mitochondrial isoform X1 [Gallus gallus]XP_040547617.1 uncharacterized protein C10orf67 homolog, mitochondrial isoform X1 [Gallus gallus]XP_040547627.1 uncharacterized protein C10orf67 homolog, mitochondrial isoform X1 [Gallus gallus]